MKSINRKITLIVILAVSVLILLFSCYKLTNKPSDNVVSGNTVSVGEVIDLAMGDSYISEDVNISEQVTKNIPDIIAHRGYCSVAPENTLEAFRRAVDVGADMIELDVQLTKDGYIVVFHDNNLSRITGDKNTVSDYTYAGLLNLDFGSYKSTSFTGMSATMMKNNFSGTKVSTLDEILEFASTQDVTVNLELKDISSAKGISQAQKDTFAAMVVARVYAYGVEDKVIFASFNHNYLSQIKRLNNNNKTLYVTHESGAAHLINDYPADAYSIDLNAITADDVEFFHNAGYPVYVWTANSCEMMNYALSLGSDGIITNYPGIARVLVHDEYEFLRDNYVGTMTAPVLYDYVDISSFSGYILSGMTLIKPENKNAKGGQEPEAFLALSAYDIEDKANSIIYKMNMNGVLTDIIDLGIKADIDSIAYDKDNDYIWITTGDEYIYALDWQELTNGKHSLSYPIDKEKMEVGNGSSLEEYTFLKGAFKLSDITDGKSVTAKFIYYDNGNLYVGYDNSDSMGVINTEWVENEDEETDGDKKNKKVEYHLELTEARVLTIPSEVSGVAIRYVYPEEERKDSKDDEEIQPELYLVMTRQVNDAYSSFQMCRYTEDKEDYSSSSDENIIPSGVLQPVYYDNKAYLGFKTSSRYLYNSTGIVNDQIWMIGFDKLCN